MLFTLSYPQWLTMTSNHNLNILSVDQSSGEALQYTTIMERENITGTVDNCFESCGQVNTRQRLPY